MSDELSLDKMLVRINMPIKLFMQVRKGLGLTITIPKSHVVLKALEKHYGKIKLSEEEDKALSIITNYNLSRRIQKRLANPNSHLSKQLHAKRKKAKAVRHQLSCVSQSEIEAALRYIS